MYCLNTKLTIDSFFLGEGERGRNWSTRAYKYTTIYFLTVTHTSPFSKILYPPLLHLCDSFKITTLVYNGNHPQGSEPVFCKGRGRGN